MFRHQITSTNINITPSGIPDNWRQYVTHVSEVDTNIQLGNQDAMRNKNVPNTRATASS